MLSFEIMVILDWTSPLILQSTIIITDNYVHVVYRLKRTTQCTQVQLSLPLDTLRYMQQQKIAMAPKHNFGQVFPKLMDDR